MCACKFRMLFLTSESSFWTISEFNSVFFVTASPIHDVNISDGQASQTKIKSFNNTSFSYSCGVESGGNDTFNAASLDFTWFAIGY